MQNDLQRLFAAGSRTHSSVIFVVLVCSSPVFVGLPLPSAGQPNSISGETDAKEDLFADEDLSDDGLFADEDDDHLFGDEEASDEERAPHEEGSGRVSDEEVAEHSPTEDGPAAVSEETVEGDSLRGDLLSSGLPSEGIEEILIQGKAAIADDLETSDSVTAFGAEDLQALGVQDVSGLSDSTPNLMIRVQSATTPTFFVRGVGLADFAANAPGAVAVYEDDVPRNAPAIQLGMIFDVEGINVLRGPQGTGPARNASAGAIKIYTHKPTGDYSTSLRGTYGNYGFQDYEGHVELPLWGSELSTRLAFRALSRDGIGENGCAGAPRIKVPGEAYCGENVGSRGLPQPSEVPPGLERKVNDQGRWAARGTLRFQPVDYDMEWLLGLHGSRLDELSRLGQALGTEGDRLGGSAGEGLDAYFEPDVRRLEFRIRDRLLARGLSGPALRRARDRIVSKHLAENLDPDPYRGDYNRTGKTRLETWGGYLRGEMSLADLTLTITTGYDGYDRSRITDQDFTPNVLFESNRQDQGWQVTQDLELSGEFGDGATWTLGGFTLVDYLEAKVLNDFSTPTAQAVAGRREYDQDQQSLGLYASFAWDLLDDFTLDGGYRYNWQRARMDYKLARGQQTISQVQTTTWDHHTGTLRLTYHLTDEVDAFMKYTRGWKSGYYNATANLRKAITAADPEKLDSWEVGLRGSWFEGRLNVRSGLFIYRYEDYQVFQVDQEAGSLPETEVINASDAENLGGELEIDVEPLEGLLLTARAAWLESQFVDFTDPIFFPVLEEDPTNPGSFTRRDVQINQDFSGNRLPNSPQFSLSLIARWDFDFGRYGVLTPRWDGNWIDDVYFDPTEGQGVENFAVEQFLPDNTLGQQAQWKHNVRLGWRSARGNIEVAGWLRNLTNEVTKVGGFNASTFRNIIIMYVGEPRTYGIDVILRF